jgi:hypothetical protein
MLGGSMVGGVVAQARDDANRYFGTVRRFEAAARK